MKIKAYLFLSTIYFCCLLGNKVTAQNKPGFIGFGLGLGTQVIFENKTTFNDYIPEFEFIYARSFQNRTDTWIQFTNAKYICYILTYMDQNHLNGLYNKDSTIYGSFTSLCPSIFLEIIKLKNKQLYLLPGFGVGYASQTYYDDNRNSYVGSKFNYSIRVEGGIRFPINSNQNMTFSIFYHHFSNGAFSLPNKGINSLSAKIGLNFNAKK